MKRFIAFFLFISILTSSFLASFGLSAKYILKPREYVERLKTVFDNFPSNQTEEITFLKGTELQYYDLGLKLPEWTDFSIDSITEVPKALGIFMNRSMTFVGAFVKELIGVIPKMFANFKIALAHYLGVIPNFIIYIGRSIKNVFTSRGYVKVVLLSLVPLDWLEMKEDNVKLRVPWFGSVYGLPLEIYYAISDNVNGETPEVDNESGDSGDNVDDGSGDFNLDTYNPNDIFDIGQA